MDKHLVFVWTEYRRWRKVVLEILNDHLDATVFAELRRNPPRYVVSDDLSWLDDTIARAKGYRPNMKAVLTERLAQHYRFVRAYHGCRPTALDSYHEKGILPCNPVELKAIARSIFSNQPGVERAIEYLADDGDYTYEEHNGGKVFFCLTKDELVEDCGHYLLQGSEYLQAVAVRIGENHVLRSRGKATVFECNVPIEHIEEDFIKDLGGAILEQIGDGILRRPLGSAGSNFGFWITVPLLPENIVSVDHPTGIPNPHNYQIRED